MLRGWHFAVGAPLRLTSCGRRLDRQQRLWNVRGLSAGRSATFCYAKVRDIYKEVSYVAPFSEEESRLILEKVNGAEEGEMRVYTSKSHAGSLIQHREANGSFEVVEQLLDVGKFEPKTLERLGKKVLRYGGPAGEEALSEAKRKGERIDAADALRKYIRPPVSRLLDYDDGIRTVTGVKFSLARLSFARMTRRDRRITDWRSLQAFEDVTARNAFEHHHIDRVARSLVSEIPESDLYVMEKPLRIVPPSSGSASSARPYSLHAKIHSLELQSALVSLLNSRSGARSGEMDDGGGGGFVHLMGVNVLDTLFDLKVGGERVAIHRKVDNIVGEKGAMRRENPFGVDVAKEPWGDYAAIGKVPFKDQMAGALMLALAFDHLAVKKV